MTARATPVREARADAVSGGIVAVLTPTGRDGRVAHEVLSRAGFTVAVHADMPTLCDAIAGERADAVGALLVAEEALSETARAALLASLDAQPSWSDLPVIVLTGEGELTHAIPAPIEALTGAANVTLLERPVRVATLVSALRAALRARRRQLDVRDHLAERGLAERTLRESESRLRDAVLSAPYPMMLHAEDGEILQLSRAWTVLTGYPPHELRTLADWELRAFPALGDVPPPRWPEPAPDDDGRAMPDERWLVRTADGRDQTWDVHTVTLAPLPDGRALRLTAAVDVTNFEALLERERAARSEAEQANRAKSDFLAMMSHELRTPLNAIGGYAQLLALGVRGPVSPTQIEDLERIDRSQRHLLSLINDILNFAKIEAGHVDVRVRPVSLREVLAGVEPLVAPQLQAKALDFSDDSADCGALVLADAEKVRQVVLNLLSNAIKFTPPNGRISVRCAVEPAVAHVMVTDSGIGIPAPQLESDLRAVRAGGAPFHVDASGHGARSRDQPRPRAAHGRRPLGEERAGHGDDVHAHAAAGGRVGDVGRASHPDASSRGRRAARRCAPRG